MSFIQKVAGLSLRDRVRDLGGLRVGLLLLDEVFWACPISGRGFGADPHFWITLDNLLAEWALKRYLVPGTMTF